jgi:hypothetical protein
VCSSDLVSNDASDVRKIQDTFIRKYFACNSLESLLQLLQDELPPNDPLLVKWRGDAIKAEEDRLNDEQRKVYDAGINQHINVMAGPGSGKTHTLTLRVAKLVHHIGNNPEEILVLAYNRAVVAELKERLGRLFNDLGYGNLAKRIKIFKQELPQNTATKNSNTSSFILVSGLLLIIFVPVFKTVTHLPPYMGMMFSLATFAILGEIASKRHLNLSSMNETEGGHVGPTLKALSKIEMPSILFFLGILMTVAGMESLGMIENLGEIVLNSGISKELYISILGLASAVIDNVPLVAASIGMFKDTMDADTWHMIAYTAGTGGSILIIGSAAGVVAMGMENIGFGWYLKRFSLLALAGYLGGVLAFLLL